MHALRSRRSSTRRLATVLVVAAAVSLSLGAAPAAALTPDPALLVGGTVALNAAGPPGWLELRSVSPGYVAYRLEQEDEYSGEHLLVRRTSDGAAVRTLEWQDSSAEPWLSGSSYLALAPVPGNGGTQVSVNDIESGASRWVVEVPSGERLVAAGETWVLSTEGSDGGGQAVLRRPGQPALELPGITLSAPGSAGPSTVADAASLVIHDSLQVWTVDLHSGAVRLVTGEAGWYDRVILTPHRIFWLDENAWNTMTLRWAERSDLSAGSVEVPDVSSTRGYFAFGDRVAAYQYEPGDDLYRAHLEPIDLTTGHRTGPVASKVVVAKSLGDGTVAMVLADTPDGRVVTVTDDRQPVHEVVDLPHIGRQATDLGFAAGRVVADFGSAYSDTDGPVMVAPGAGQDTWSSALRPDDPVMDGGLIAARGSTVLTQLPDVAGQTLGRLSWPGGSRDITDVGGATLQPGGSVLLRWLSTGVSVEDVRTGRVLKSVSRDTAAAVDGRTLYRGPDAHGVLTTSDLDGRRPDSIIDTAVVDCSVDGLQVVDRFALIQCGDDFTAVDLQGILAPRVLTQTDHHVTDLRLGNGFVTWARYEKDPNGEDYAVALVQDLGPDNTLRRYGPLHGRYSLPNVLIGVDDDRPGMVYADTRLLPRIVDLHWLSTAPVTAQDTAAPFLDSLSGSPRVGGATVSVRWAYTDTTNVPGELPSGVASYDVRYRQGPVGGTPGGWVQPEPLQGIQATQAQLTAAAGSDTCWSVRARDKAGNVSDWSSPWCSAVDGTAPVLTATSGAPSLSDSTRIRFGWAFTDPTLAQGLPGSGLASYDVRYQQSPRPGAAYAGWVQPTAWQTLTAKSVTLMAPRGVTTCLQVRARDRVGRLSTWSPSRCSVIDFRAPVITLTTVGGLLVPRTTSTTVTFRYRAKDDTTLRSYDVAYRQAVSSYGFGPVKHPASWAGTTSTSRSLSVAPGGEACFSTRARDTVGNLSGWSSWKCAVVPLDDRKLAKSSHVTRTTSRLALAGTLSRLDRRDASLRAAHQFGRTISVSVLRGPTQGKIDVYVGTRRVGTLSLHSSTTQRTWLTMKTAAFKDSTITFRSVSSARASIDAWAVQR